MYNDYVKKLDDEEEEENARKLRELEEKYHKPQNFHLNIHNWKGFKSERTLPSSSKKMRKQSSKRKMRRMQTTNNLKQFTGEGIGCFDEILEIDRNFHRLPKLERMNLEKSFDAGILLHKTKTSKRPGTKSTFKRGRRRGSKRSDISKFEHFNSP